MRHIFAALIMACFTFLAVGVYAEDLNNSAFNLQLFKSHQQTTPNLKFDGKGEPKVGYDVQACQSEFHPCFKSSDCCGSMMCKEHSSAGWVCY